MNDILEGLNDVQRQAAMAVDGPLLILAGAGSGKTKTLTHRIAYLIGQRGVWPDQILAVTFTNKAAREMRQRLWQLTNPRQGDGAPPRSFMPWMGTFHSICVRILRERGSAIGIDTNFVIYDEDDRRSLIKRVIKELAISTDQVKPQYASSVISNAKNSMTSPAEFAAEARMPRERAVADVYHRYEELRQEAHALDFDDLLVEVVRLLRDSAETRAYYRELFHYILIDEYQDTNAAQYAIVKLLINPQQNICVVGDDWQSIYSWRGADFTNILNFTRDFPGAQTVKLEQNYRSTSAILEAAQSVITKNLERSEKKLWTDSHGGLPVQIHPVYDETEEAYLVAQTIQRAVDDSQRQFGDFAVLYRTNAQSFAFERMLLQFHIPYQIVGGVRFYDRREVKDVLAYLRLVYQPNDMVSFSRIANLPARGLGTTSLEKFLIWQSRSPYDIIGALVNAEQAEGLTARAKKAFAALGQTLRQVQARIASGSGPSEIIEQMVTVTGYRESLLDGTPQAEEREANIGVLIGDAKMFASLEDFLAEAALMSSTDQSSDKQKVTLMTLHAAKGLEFPAVFMVGMEDGLFPSSRALEAGPRQLEEERRLCYVGMTRAREELHLSYAQNRMTYGSRSYGAPSRFIQDMGQGVAYVAAQSARPSAVNDFGEIMMEFEVGDRVRSPQFGVGEIIDVDGLAVSVSFVSGSTKTLNIEFARLQKL